LLSQELFFISNGHLYLLQQRLFILWLSVTIFYFFVNESISVPIQSVDILSDYSFQFCQPIQKILLHSWKVGLVFFLEVNAGAFGEGSDARYVFDDIEKIIQNGH
jgi:hypothetical protein